MKLAILSRNRKLHSIQRLLKEAALRRIECRVFDPLDCQVVVGKGTSNVLVHGRSILPIDVVLPRIGTSITDYGLAVVKQLEILGGRSIRVLNGSQAIAQSRDKLRCLQVLSDEGIDVPVTVLMRGNRWTKLALRLIQGTPAVLKLLQGTQGVGVMLVESAPSAQSVLDAMHSIGQDVILQQFISESGGRDIRAFVIGDRVVAAMSRHASSGEFRSNLHRGGEGHPVDLEPVYEKLAVKAAKILGLEVAGVDMLESITGPKVIEVNSSPGFEGIEKATGLNIARMIVDHTRERPP